MIWSASQSNVADQEKGLRVGVDPGGLLERVCCCHLPAEVAAVEKEVVGGRSQLEPLAALPAQLAPRRHGHALVQQPQAQLDDVQLPKALRVRGVCL